MSDTSESYTFIFSNNGKDISLRRAATTAERLARYFNFDPSSVLIKEEFGSRVEFPSEQNDKFNFAGFADGTSFMVMGDELADVSNTLNASSTASSTSTASVFSTIATSSRPWTSTNSKAAAGYTSKAKATIKVVRAQLTLSSSGKAVLASTGKQTFVPIFKEEDANVPYITSYVKNNMKEHDLVVVGSNGIEYDDEPGTRSLNFWKMGSRKVFAINTTKRPKKSSSGIDLQTSSSDSDDGSEGVSHSKKVKLQRKEVKRLLKSLSALEEKVDSIHVNQTSIKSDVSQVLKLDEKSKVPLALKNAVTNTFSCKICFKSPMEAPITVSRCCGTIVGCAKCVHTWYGNGHGGDTFEKSCPICRAEGGYSNTFRLVGLDDFLNVFREIDGDE